MFVGLNFEMVIRLNPDLKFMVLTWTWLTLVLDSIYAHAILHQMGNFMKLQFDFTIVSDKLLICG